MLEDWRAMLFLYLKEHYGDVASVGGLLVSFFGFVVTILGVSKAKKAAEDARKAAREAVSRIKSQILVGEISSCLQIFKDIDEGCTARNWNVVMEGCGKARMVLPKILVHQALDDSEKKSIRIAIDQLGNLSPYVQKIRNSEPPRDVSAPKMKEIHEMIIQFVQIQGRLESQTFEVN